MLEMKDKICVVTGANSGIGKVTVRELARLGATVVMVCRDPEKAERARAEISAQLSTADLHVLLADFASLAQVRSLASRLNEGYERVDVLINNAGMLARERTLTEEGIEATVAVNYLSAFLLTNLLLDLLKRADRARVVSVASEVHRWARFDPENLQLERDYAPYKAYCAAKLALVMFTHELAKRLRGTGVTANCLHPGVIASNFGRSAPLWFRGLMSVSRPFLTSADKGAETSIYLATSPEVQSVSGKYFKNRRMVEPAPQATDDALTGQLWTLSARLAGIETPALATAS